MPAKKNEARDDPMKIDLPYEEAMKALLAVDPESEPESDKTASPTTK